MHNRHMERSAAYSGIVGAILYIVAGVITGMPPSATESGSAIAAFVTSHNTALALSAWLTLPAVAFILWFTIGLFDYLREPNDTDRTLAQWGVAAAVVWAALNVGNAAVTGAATIRNPGAGASFPMLYILDIVLYVFGFGAFAAFAFAAANEGRRQGAMPGWLNALGYLVFIVDAAFTLTLFASTGTFAITGVGTIVTPVISALWILFASIVLLTRIPKAA